MDPRSKHYADVARSLDMAASLIDRQTFQAALDVKGIGRVMRSGTLAGDAYALYNKMSEEVARRLGSQLGQMENALGHISASANLAREKSAHRAGVERVEAERRVSRSNQ